MVMDVRPTLHRIYSQMVDSPDMGMDLVCRVLFEDQQDYFSWVGEVGTGWTRSVRRATLSPA